MVVPVSENENLTVGSVARLVGVSVRTLHHYDDIGLVEPSGRTAAGYRSYSASDIERLHQVLTYRELGFTLSEIQEILAADSVDAMAHLRRQHDLLEERIERLQEMATAVEKMMEAKKMGIQLSAQEQREIFGDNWQGEEYAAEAEERWGKTEAWKQSQERTAKFTKDDWIRVKADTDALEAAFATALADGVQPGSAEANALAERHLESLRQFSDTSHEMQVCIANMYTEDSRFEAHYEAVAPGLARYVRDVVVANAEQKG